MFEGRGPLAILLIVLVGRPRVEPDAVRAADDSDQPGHHRRRRAGRIAQRRGFLLGAAYGAAMAVRAMASSGSIVILTAGTFGTINSSPVVQCSASPLLFVVPRAGDVRRAS